MLYALFASLFAAAGSSLLALWFKHKEADARRDLYYSRKAHADTLGEFEGEKALHRDTGNRLEAVVRGLKVEAARLEKEWHAHLEKCPIAAGDYVRSQLSLSETSDTTATVSSLQNRPSTQRKPGGSGGSS